MKIDVRPRHKNAPRIAEKSAPGFLQWLRGRECLFAQTGHQCEGKLEAMHVDFAGGKGVATKVADKFAVPCCSALHRRQHDRGWTTFLREFGLSKEALLDAAESYWRRWPGRRAWEDRNA